MQKTIMMTENTIKTVSKLPELIVTPKKKNNKSPKSPIPPPPPMKPRRQASNQPSDRTNPDEQVSMFKRWQEPIG
jgi:hypothetical protein